MASVDRRSRGAMVEAAARRHLLAAGLTDVASNASYRGGEIDLVMLDRDGRAGSCLVFIEVRYRSAAAFGGGLMSIDARKRRKLVHAAQLFLASHRQFALSACRFDVVVADGDASAPNITWLRDAFRADDPA
ncbi:YraN family protein [Cognatiluteimonas profundi]|uniref:YraN family protein n=1 Tax=Cognatiluteimonas profundi TaxID=2594501 RepID=UPI00227812AD|nr:YraN family protein [Lysobacter profundi]